MLCRIRFGSLFYSVGAGADSSGNLFRLHSYLHGFAPVCLPVHLLVYNPHAKTLHLANQASPQHMKVVTLANM